MKIDEGLEILEIKADLIGNPAAMNAVLIWDDSDVILVDTALPGLFNNITRAFESAGVAFERLSKIIITHQDVDHIGNLSMIVNSSKSKIEVIAHEEEKPYIQLDKRPIKYNPERKEMYANLKANVGRTVVDGEELPYCGGIIIIHTPGHTPGHICLYLKKYGTLITGDAMNIVNGQLVGPMPQYTYNLEEAYASLKKLEDFNIRTVVCYHGGIFRDGPNEKIRELANRK